MSERNKNGAGKGDSYRPIKKSVFDKNYDGINWGSNIKVCPNCKKNNKNIFNVCGFCGYVL